MEEPPERAVGPKKQVPGAWAAEWMVPQLGAQHQGRPNVAEVGGGRGCLFVVAVAVGSWLAAALAMAGVTMPMYVVAGLGLALLYPFVAAWVVGICEDLERWSFPKRTPERKRWDVETRAYAGAFWPVSLLFWLVISPFFAIINRVFRD
jgi:hypothetical protein